MPAIPSAWNALPPSLCMADYLTSFSSPFSGHLCRGSGAKLLLLCLRNPVDCSLWGSSVHGIFQARILEWVAISSSMGSSQEGRESNQLLVHLPASAGRFFPLVPSGSFQQIIYVKYTYIIIYFSFPVYFSTYFISIILWVALQST